jgi:hypothetical protein
MTLLAPVQFAEPPTPIAEPKASRPFLESTLESFHMTYAVGEELGGGSFGTVHKATRKRSGEVFAVKVLNLVHSSAKSHLLAEVESIKALEHPNVLRTLGAYWSACGWELYLVQQLAVGGEIFDWIKRQPRWVCGTGGSAVRSLCCPSQPCPCATWMPAERTRAAVRSAWGAFTVDALTAECGSPAA